MAASHFSKTATVTRVQTGIAASADAAGSPEPLLEVDQIQGNVLAGFNKDHQVLMALAIRDVAAARRWLGRIRGNISSTAEVLQFNRLFSAQRARLGADPPGLVATWVNVAFSHGGLTKLISRAHADTVPDTPFREGLPARSAGLGDPVSATGGHPTDRWLVGGIGDEPDILLIVAGDDLARLDDVCALVRPGSDDENDAPAVVWQERGETRPDLPGHEHFGFKDGISQPAVRGRLESEPDTFLSSRVVVDAPDGEMGFAWPGQPLVWPGQFVFGYPSTDGSSASGAGPVAPAEDTPAWIRNGSLLVFRRLKQDVAGFTRFIRDTATALAGSSVPGLSFDGLGALIVGRWHSGAPVSRAPVADMPTIVTDQLSNNDFVFTTDTPTPVLRPGVPAPDDFPRALADVRGAICPHAAHIRKMNPRDHDSDLGDQFDTLTRRILRRGIPYGPPLADSATDDHRDRGLHFLCYQTSIERQFEVLQRNWANRADAPRPRGHDIVIGQRDGVPLEFELLTGGGTGSEVLTVPASFVTPTGGGYFFAPSLRTIDEVLAGGILPEA